MTLAQMMWTAPAEEVLDRLRSEATYPPAQDPWPTAWPYNPLTAPTQYLPLYERTQQ